MIEQYLYDKMMELLPSKARVIMYLIKKTEDPNFDGFIHTKIKTVAQEVKASYATTQKVFDELDLHKKGYLFRYQKGSYIPLVPITGLSEQQMYEIAKKNKISSTTNVIHIGKKKYLCPTQTSLYLVEKLESQGVNVRVAEK